MELFYLAPADRAGAEALWKGHPGKSNKGSFLSHNSTAPGPPGGEPYTAVHTLRGLRTDDPHTQHSSPSSVHSRQGTHKATSLHKAGNRIPPRAGQGSRPTQARPLPYILVGSKLENKGFPPAWELGEL